MAFKTIDLTPQQISIKNSELMDNYFDFVTGIMLTDKYDLEIYTNWNSEFICTEMYEEDNSYGYKSYLINGDTSILDFIMNWYNDRKILHNKDAEKNKIAPWFDSDYYIRPCIAKIKPTAVRKLLKLFMYLNLFNEACNYKYRIENDCNGDTYIDICNTSKTYRIVFDFDEENKTYIIYSITLIENDNDKV